MKRAVTIFLGLVFASCANETAIIDSQVRNIENYLNRVYGDENDYYVATGIYRYVVDNAFGNTGTPLKKNDPVTLRFEFYRFVTSPDVKPFFTNIQAVAETLGVNIEGWNFEPLSVKLGSGTMLAAIEKALIGCRQGDRVEVFITSDHAYGNNHFGYIDKNTSLMARIEIE